MSTDRTTLLIKSITDCFGFQYFQQTTFNSLLLFNGDVFGFLKFIGGCWLKRIGWLLFVKLFLIRGVLHEVKSTAFIEENGQWTILFQEVHSDRKIFIGPPFLKFSTVYLLRAFTSFFTLRNSQLSFGSRCVSRSSQHSLLVFFGSPCGRSGLRLHTRSSMSCRLQNHWNQLLS